MKLKEGKPCVYVQTVPDGEPVPTGMITFRQVEDSLLGTFRDDDDRKRFMRHVYRGRVAVVWKDAGRVNWKPMESKI